MLISRDEGSPLELRSATIPILPLPNFVELKFHEVSCILYQLNSQKRKEIAIIGVEQLLEAFGFQVKYRPERIIGSNLRALEGYEDPVVDLACKVAQISPFYIAHFLYHESHRTEFNSEYFESLIIRGAFQALKELGIKGKSENFINNYILLPLAKAFFPKELANEIDLRTRIRRGNRGVLLTHRCSGY